MTDTEIKQALTRKLDQFSTIRTLRCFQSDEKPCSKMAKSTFEDSGRWVQNIYCTCMVYAEFHGFHSVSMRVKTVTVIPAS